MNRPRTPRDTKVTATLPPAGRRASAITASVLLLSLLFAAPPWHHARAAQTQVAAPAPVTAAPAARPRKLPAPDKIIGEYLKALGGKKRVAGLRDATYEWAVLSGGKEAGRARTQLKWPASAREEFKRAGGAETVSAANARSAWERGPEGALRTLTGAESLAARLRAALDAGRLADYKKQNVLARTAGFEQADGEAAYVVEFATREGARLRYHFGAATKLPLKIVDEARRLTVSFGDYRASSPGGPQIEPHRVEIRQERAEPLTLELREARYNAGLSDALFEPPAEAALDIPALLKELTRNQDEIDQRINDYTFTRMVTSRQVSDRGELKKTSTSVHEVYPVQGYGWVMKLVSTDGVPLSPEQAAKEEKRVAEELARAEREGPKRLEEWKRKRAERAAKRRAKAAQTGGGGAPEEFDEDEDDLGIGLFLRASEFVSPRRERFGDRDVIVSDFRGRPGFKPSSRAESIASKLVGVAWIDPAEKQVVRLEARFAEGVKIAGGLLASLKPGAAFVAEQTRLADGVWLPRFSQFNASVKVFLVAGITINETHEFGDYKRFSAKTGDATLDAPQPAKP